MGTSRQSGATRGGVDQHHQPHSRVVMNFFEFVETALLVLGVLVGVLVAGFATTALRTVLSSAKRWSVVHTPGSAVDNVVYRSSEGSVFVFDFRFKPNAGWEAQIVRQPSYRGRNTLLPYTRRGHSHSGRHIAEWEDRGFAWTLDHAREQAATWAEDTILYIRTGAFDTLVDRHPAGPQFDAATPEGSYDHPIPDFPIVRSDKVDTGAEYRTADGAIFVFDFRRRFTKWRTHVRRAPRLCLDQTQGYENGVPEPGILHGRNTMRASTSLREARSFAATWAEGTARFAATGDFAAPPPETRGDYTDTDA